MAPDSAFTGLSSRHLIAPWDEAGAKSDSALSSDTAKNGVSEGGTAHLVPSAFPRE
jgi:hypothetical protein